MVTSEQAEGRNGHGHDPRKMLFLSFDKNNPQALDWRTWQSRGDYNPDIERGDVAAMGANPTIYHLNSAKEGISDPGVVIRTIREHVRKYGTLKEPMIDGHGFTNHIGLTAPIFTENFLYDVFKLQQELGTKIADRIVFGGCRVFADLGSGDVAYYKNIARDLHAEIVGATTTTYSDPSRPVGRFVKFTPDGVVKRDQLDTPIRFWLENQLSPGSSNKPQDGAWLASELHPNPTPSSAVRNNAIKRGDD